MRKITVFTALIIMIIIIAVVGYFHDTNSLNRRNKNKLAFYELEANGILSEFKGESRGSVKLEYVNNLGDVEELPLLPIAFELSKFNIQREDSISKRKNSSVLNFYKKVDASWAYCCAIEISMPN